MAQGGGQEEVLRRLHLRRPQRHLRPLLQLLPGCQPCTQLVHPYCLALMEALDRIAALQPSMLDSTTRLLQHLPVGFDVLQTCITTPGDMAGAPCAAHKCCAAGAPRMRRRRPPSSPCAPPPTQRPRCCRAHVSSTVSRLGKALWCWDYSIQ